MKYIVAGLLLLSAPSLAGAEEAAAPAETPLATQPRFFPLDSVRSGRPQLKTAVPVVHTLRSDTAEMKNGFFRVDRTASLPVAPQHALLVSPQATSSTTPRVIYGTTSASTTTSHAAAPLAMTTPAAMMMPATVSAKNADPVLSLFNTGEAGPLPSFRDTLLGRAGTTTGPAATAPSLGNRFSWPLPTTAPQKISSTFGYRADPFDHHTEFHSGIDIAAAKGTPVLASADGQVAKVGTNGQFGQEISILHPDGSESLYSHLSAENVALGQQVKAGQPIGAVGDSGHTTGAHLDYRILKNGEAVDPLSVLTSPANTTAANAATRPVVNPRSERLIVVR